MQRTRLLKPSVCRDEALVELPYQTRLVYLYLPTIADREGRLEDRPKRIKMELFPADDLEIDAELERLAKGSSPLIQRYEAEGVRVVQILNWHDIQKPHHQEVASVLPSFESASHPAELADEADDLGDSAQDVEQELPAEPRERSNAAPADAPPPVDAIDELDDDRLRDAIREWLAYRREQHRFTPKARALAKLATDAGDQASRFGVEAVVVAINKAMASGWKSFDCVRGSPTVGAKGHQTGFTRKTDPLTAAEQYLSRSR